MKSTVMIRSLVVAIVCVLAMMLTLSTAMADEGHGAGILPDDSAQEAPQHDEMEDGASMTEDHMGDDTTETHDESMTETGTDDSSHESSATTEDAAKTTSSDPEPAEQEIHDSAGERYTVNATDTNGYPVAAGITLGAVVLFGLALRNL